MSETTSESGQAHLADEPSMEDILDSIRKIIADDDQTMDIAPPQALGEDKAESNIAELNPSLRSTGLSSDTVLAPAADYDENSVFGSQRAWSQQASDTSESFDDDETVDLDIEALLSEAETQPESIENLSLKSFEVEEDLTDMLDLEIPEQEDDSLSVASEADNISMDAELDGILDLSEQIEGAQTDNVPVATESADEDDSLFDELEGLLAEEPEDEALQYELKQQTPAEPESDLEDLDDILEDVMAEPQTAPEPATPSQSDSSDKTAFHSDEADMDMVKSLMADLTEPETSSEAHSGTEAEASQVEESNVSFDEGIQDLDDMLEDFQLETVAPEPDSHVTPESQSVSADFDDADLSEDDLDDSDILDEIINMSLENEFEEGDDPEVNLQIPDPEDAGEKTLAQEEYDSESLGEDPLNALIEETETDASETDYSETDESESPVTAQSLISSLMEIAGAAEQDAEAAEAELDKPRMKDEGVVEIPMPSSGDAASADVTPLIVPPHNNPAKETADMPKAAVNQDRILDEVSEQAASSAFASLNNMVEEKAIKAERGDRIGDLVMEALRPMLKEWLDEHLKDIVERAVQKEVQRISSGK